jgi:CDP-2,3-bis-(O-geranylgeranyl)-sn-glycerol synthase
MENDILQFILGAIWFVLPAYFANATPNAFGGGPPIDGGRLWRDGRPILGPGKTWRGLFVGVFFGTLIGIGQGFFIEVNDPSKAIIRSFFISFGSLLGDSMGSFIKRRAGLKRGQSFMFMDQLGFLIVGTILVVLFFPLTLENVSFVLFDQTITYDLITILIYLVFLLPLTFIVHITANLIWYFLGQQDVPI